MLPKRLVKLFEELEDLIDSRSDITREELTKVFKNYERAKHGQAENGFQSNIELVKWYLKQFIKQDGKYCYCETSIAVFAFPIQNFHCYYI